MPNPILPKRSSTASAIPTAGALQIGEIAINLADRKLYAKDGSSAVVQIGGDVVGAASSTDKAIPRFSGTGGKTLQNSGITIDDLNNIIGVGAMMKNVMFQDTGWDWFDLGATGTTAQTLNYLNGSAQRLQATGNFTLSTSNWPPSGTLGEILLEFVADGTLRTVTWPTINWVTSTGAVTTTFASNGVARQSANGAIDWILLWTRDGGTTIYGKFLR